MVLGLTVYGAHDVPQPGGWAAVQLWASESHSVPQRDNPRPQLQGLEGQGLPLHPPRNYPFFQIPALRCTGAQLDFGGRDSEDTRRALRDR